MSKLQPSVHDMQDFVLLGMHGAYECLVVLSGFHLDRCWAIVQARSMKFLSLRHYPKLAMVSFVISQIGWWVGN